MSRRVRLSTRCVRRPAYACRGPYGPERLDLSPDAGTLRRRFGDRGSRNCRPRKHPSTSSDAVAYERWKALSDQQTRSLTTGLRWSWPLRPRSDFPICDSQPTGLPHPHKWLDSKGVGVWNSVNPPSRQRCDRRRAVDPDVFVELPGKFGLKVVAGELGFRPVDDPDSAF